MIIKIVMGIFLLLLLYLAYYLWHNRNGHFLIFNSQNNPYFTTIMSWTAVLLGIECILGFILLFQANKYLNFITLIISSITILTFSLLINQINE
ncbi:hypothetical protein OZX59_01230 [Lactobacillus sp. ESL0681]|nr:hypothetical protein [Lactobacillus sp. ESL0681]WEV40564.1 hypothetical protein OZX59_01230 [Lactobacillus sp. ESL0681]